MVDAILGLVTGDAGRYVLSLLAGFLMKKSPKFVNKAIPIVLAIGNFIVALAHSFIVPTVSAFGGVDSTGAGVVGPWYSSLGTTIVGAALTWLLAIGTHSAAKNTRELLR